MIGQERLNVETVVLQFPNGGEFAEIFRKKKVKKVIYFEKVDKGVRDQVQIEKDLRNYTKAVAEKIA